MTSSFHVERVLGLATFQDRGHRGLMHAAVPPGGALVPELLVAANRAVDNPDDAPCIEVQGRLSIISTAEIAYAIDEQPARSWRDGTAIDVASGSRRCAYLAVRGGFVGVQASFLAAGPRFRGALLCAGDEPLRTGAAFPSANLPPVRRDVLPTADIPPLSAAREADRDSDVIRVVPGPDLDAFAGDALDILTGATFRISPASNRVGTRLDGPLVPRRADDRERSRPMVIGALEVPRDGKPIVLGPEHPTTGGYPLIAVVASADLGRFHAIRLGGSVRFAVS